MLIWQKWTTTNNKIEQIKENEDEEYEYDNKNTEDIYDGDIYYNGGVDQEELDGPLKNT